MNETDLPIIDEWRTTVYSGRYEVDRSGRVRNRKTKKILKPYSNGRYLKVKLIDADGNKFQPFVHRLVAQAFLPTDGVTGLDVDHFNGNTQDNNLYNLRWLTPQENAKHRGNMMHMKKLEREMATYGQPNL